MKEVIKFAGHRDDLVWMYPKTKIHENAVIIVDKGYQAIMVRNGEIEMPYSLGESKVFSDKQRKFSIFRRNKYVTNCRIYYFKISRDVLSRKWGTKYPIKYFDKFYNKEFSIRAHGTYKLYLNNPRIFLKNIVVTDKLNYTIENMIKDLINIKITEVINKLLMLKEYNLLNIRVYFNEIIEESMKLINKELEEFGLSIFDLVILELLPLEEFNKIVEEESSNEEITYELRCSKCDAIIKEEMDYCINCGEKLSEDKDGEENVCIQTNG